jgi:hypothetical protein
MRVLFLLLAAAVYGFALEKHSIAPKSVVDGKFMGIKILDSKIVNISRIDGEKFYGISGIAYDENRDILYAVNDRGRLFSFRVIVKDNKIIDLKPISGYRLKDEHGRKFLKPKSDSEGLALIDDGDKKALLISFERYPRIMKFDVYGHGKKAKFVLPKRLKNIKNFQGPNGALEALTYHPKYGYLTTGEYPLKGQLYPYHGIYDKNGEVCRFKQDYFGNAVTEFEMLKDGNILVLQRDIDLKKFTINIILKKVYINKIENGICKSKNLALLKSDDGWDLDNFEGLTHYKDNIYFMISDDNGNFFQKTILTMFELLDSK